MVKDTKDRIREVILGADPVATVGDISDVVDVSRTTVHNHLEELLEEPGINSREIGQATVLWYNLGDSLKEREFSEADFEKLQEGVQEEFHRDLVHSRAEWLDAKSRYQKMIRNGAMEAIHRVYLWSRFRDYVQSDTQLRQAMPETSEGTAPSNTGTFHGEEVYLPELPSPSGSISEDELEWCAREAPLFTTDWLGEVSGLQYVTIYDTRQRQELVDRVGGYEEIEDLTVQDVDAEVIEEVYPPANDILAAGEIFDRLQSDMRDMRW